MAGRTDDNETGGDGQGFPSPESLVEHADGESSTSAGDRLARLRGFEPDEDPAPSVDDMCRVFERDVRHFMSERFADDPAAVAQGCVQVMVLAAERLAAGRRRPRAEELRSWLLGLAGEVAHGLRTTGVDPTRGLGASPPEAVPLSLRVHLAVEAERERQERVLERADAPGDPIADAVRALRLRVRDHLRGLRDGAPVVYCALRLRRAYRGAVRSGRAGMRRAETAVSPLTTQAAPRFAEFVNASPVLSQAAAVAVAVASLGMAAAPPPARPAAPVAAPVRGAPIAAHDGLRPSPVAEPPPGPAAPPDRRPAPDTPASPPHPRAGTSGDVLPVPATPVPPPTRSPRVDPGPADSTPIDGHPHPSGKDYWIGGNPPVGADLDGDGRDDVARSLPLVEVNCPEPGHRGALTTVACPVVEATGVGQ